MSQQQMLSIKDLTEILVKHQNLHEGLYDLNVEFMMGFGQIGPTPEQVLPGAMLGLSRFGLNKVEHVGPNTVDAAVANPLKKTRAKTKPG